MRSLLVVCLLLALGTPAIAAAAGKDAKAKKKAADPGLELDLDESPAAPPKAAAPAPSGSADLDLDLDSPAAPAKPAAPVKSATPAPAAKPGADLGLDIGLDEVVATKPVEAAPKPAAPVAPPPKPKPTAPTPAPQRDIEETEGAGVMDDIGPFHRVEASLKFGGLMFSGRPDDATIGTGAAPVAGRGITVPTMLEARVRPTPSLAELAIVFEAGIFPKSGAVKRELAYDPDFKSTTSTYSIIAVPLTLGVTYDLPFKLNFDSIGFGVRAAFVGQYTRSRTTWTTNGADVLNAAQSGFALGWLIGAESTIAAGPGVVVIDLRYAQAFTDLGMRDAYAAQGAQAQQPYNRVAMGDVQGTNLLAGYRLLF